MAARGRGALARWAAVGLLVATLVALPSIVAALPADDADVPAADLRAAVLASALVGLVVGALIVLVMNLTVHRRKAHTGSH